MSSRLRNALVAIGSCLLLAACGALGVDGNGQRSTETRPLTGFSGVRSASSLDVSVARGDTFEVTVSIDENLQPLVITRVVGATLEIDVEGGIGDVLPGPQVLVTMPVLAAAGVEGSGRLVATGFAQSQSVDLTVDGSGALAFEGDVPAAAVRVSGSGDARLTGSTSWLTANVDGSGSVDARAFAATTADLSVSGSGSVAATVTASVRVAISGSGDVDLFGAPALERAETSGSGSLRVH